MGGKSLIKGGGSPLGLLEQIATAQGAKPGPSISGSPPEPKTQPSSDLGSRSEASARGLSDQPVPELGTHQESRDVGVPLGKEQGAGAPERRRVTRLGVGRAGDGRRQQTYYIGELLIRELKIFSAHSSRQISEIVNAALGEYLARARKP